MRNLYNYCKNAVTLVALSFVGLSLFAQDYPIVFDKNQNYTHASRRLNSVMLNRQTISLPTPLKVYSNVVETSTFVAKKGDKLSPAFGFSGTWMNGFVYIDYGCDGSFDVQLNADGTFPQDCDIAAFSYAEPDLGSGVGYNSMGQKVTNANVLNPPPFYLPADLPTGFYRMRYKVDWASIDPAGRAEDGNGILKNGGAICDVRLNVHDGYCNISVVDGDGQIVFLTQPQSNGRRLFGKPLKIKIIPNEGYVVDVVKMRHGYNLNGEEYIHGLKQYSDELVPGFLVKNNEYEIPGEFMDGNILIEVVYAPIGIEGGEGYELSFDKNQEGEENAYTISVNGKQFSKINGATDYYDLTSSAPFILNKTRNISVAVKDDFAKYATDKYLYIDLNNDGKFSPVFSNEGGVQKPAASSELVAYTYYKGKNSIGDDAESCSSASLPQYQLPALLPDGVYRARLKLDKDNISPAGSDKFGDDGCIVVDFLLNVISTNCSLKLYAENGSIDGANSTALPLTVSASQNIIGVLRGAPGHKTTEVVVRHGHNLGGEQYVNGNRQWSQEVIEAMSDGKFVIPASLVDGNVEIYAEFEKANGSDWQLVFSDEFNAEDYSQPLDSKWMRCQRYSATWNRWLSDSKEVVYLQGGDLVTRAIPNPDTASDPVPMITGGIKSNNRFGFTYGYVEARIFSNPWVGNFPAFWMMPENQSAGWPDCGEIDIWEAIDTEARSYHTVHSNWTYDLKNTNNPRSSYNTGVSYDRYHTYALKWDETTLIWYVDGKEVGRYTKSSNQSALDQGQWPFDKHFHLILNQSVGNGSWATNADVSHVYETRFDWVRVYQREGMLNTNGTVGVPVVEQDDAVEVLLNDGGVVLSTSVPTMVKITDLSGRCYLNKMLEGDVNIPLSNGFYIINGKKVLVK